jgi:hypothetical protein
MLEGDGPCFFCHSLVTKTQTMHNPEWVQALEETVRLSLQARGAASASASSKDDAEAAPFAQSASASATPPAASASAAASTSASAADSTTGPAPSIAAAKKPSAALTKAEQEEEKRMAEGLKKAVAHKNKLLTYAKEQGTASVWRALACIERL